MAATRDDEVRNKTERMAFPGPSFEPNPRIRILGMQAIPVPTFAAALRDAPSSRSGAPELPAPQPPAADGDEVPLPDSDKLIELTWDDSDVTVHRKLALDWDDEEGLTHRSHMPWAEDEDDVTIPRRFADLCADARAIVAQAEIERREQRDQRDDDSDEPCAPEPDGDEEPDTARSEEPKPNDAPAQLTDTASDAPAQLTDTAPDVLVVSEADSAPTARVAPGGTQTMVEPYVDHDDTVIEVTEVDIDISDLLKRTQRELPRLTDTAVGLEKADVVNATPIPDARRSSELPRVDASSSVAPVAITDTRSSVKHRNSSTRWMRFAGMCSAAVLLLCIAVVALQMLPSTGGLRVELRSADGNVPSKAEIFVDGQKVCDTDPCVLAGLNAGVREVKAITRGKVVTARAKIVAGEDTVIVVDLPTAPAKQGIKASSAHRDVHLLVDGVDRGALPIELVNLQPGQHEVEFRSDRFEPLSRTVEVKAGQIVDLGEPELVATKIGVLIDLVPQDAVVTLRRKGHPTQELAGEWPRTVALEPGNYRLEARRAGHHKFSQKLTLATDRPERRVAIELVTVPRRAARAKTRSAAPDDDVYADMD